MFWKKDNDTEKKLRQLNEIVKKSFSNVKKDTTDIFKWLNFFYKKSMEQEQVIAQLQAQLSYMPKTREEIRRIVDDYYSFEGITSKIRDLNYRVDELVRAHHQIQEPASTIERSAGTYDFGKRLERLEQKKAALKERIVSRITRNSKEYIKSVIISYIRKYEKISALQLKDIVVDEQNFCSKSSFYRILEEIETMEEIGVIKQAKEKQYISKAMKRI